MENTEDIEREIDNIADIYADKFQDNKDISPKYFLNIGDRIRLSMLSIYSKPYIRDC